ncbi:MAG: GSCFA domain-containing protein [Bacteroidota bacterium]|nr:GSCFA domain-containing protein [Bacteroidota bacterium]
MDLRTTFNIAKADRKITYNDPVMFLGSCFATSIGRQFELGHMPVLINPSGTIYNPVSVINTLNTITDKRKYSLRDLYNHNGTWVSFSHYTDFSSDDPDEILKKINKRSEEALKFMSGVKYLFITFGTARVYRWNETGSIVSNCHKIPAFRFTRELLTPDDIVSLWNKEMDKLESLFPELRIVFTISPVRHWKDGAHGNQVSKSVLFVAVEELLKHRSGPEYFPSYELLMDDLRDYRYYADDMLHPSDLAVEYIWNAFKQCYFDKETIGIWLEAVKITKAFSHRLRNDAGKQVRQFAENIIRQIDSLSTKVPGIDFKDEMTYFEELLKRK